MNDQQVKAHVSQEVTVTIKISVFHDIDGKQREHEYAFLIPSGVPYDEAYGVALEMASVIKNMQQQSKELAQQQADKGAEDVTK